MQTLIYKFLTFLTMSSLQTGALVSTRAWSEHTCSNARILLWHEMRFSAATQTAYEAKNIYSILYWLQPSQLRTRLMRCGNQYLVHDFDPHEDELGKNSSGRRHTFEGEGWTSSALQHSPARNLNKIRFFHMITCHYIFLRFVQTFTAIWLSGWANSYKPKRRAHEYAQSTFEEKLWELPNAFSHRSLGLTEFH
jgi:hypothetical protein